MAAGVKTGGRQKGGLNKRTLELQALAEAAPGEDTPLDFLTRVYRNERHPIDLRVEAAGKAAPYVHPKLAAVTIKGDAENPLQVLGKIEMVPVEPQPRDGD